MSEDRVPLPSCPDISTSTLDIPEIDLVPLTYDPTAPGYSQPSCGLPANTDPIPGPSRDDPLGPNPIDRSLNAKVPIPRTTHPISWTSSGRVSRACENCREQKSKCSGHRPACLRCQDAGVQCSYGDRKREKLMKQLGDLNAQVHVYENLLRDLYPRLDSSSAQHVDQTLGGQLVRAELRLPSPSVSRPDAGATGHPLATVDHTEEDFNRDEKVQAMGFVGEHSEMAWLYRLKRELDQDTTTPVGENLDRPSISSLNYFQDDTEISTLDCVDISVRPPQNVADKLVDDYFQAVHPAFPIIGKEVFIGQYRSFYLNTTVRPGKRWLAVLNLVFAIASRHSVLVDGQLPGGHVDHWEYFARAWRLSIGNVALLDHPNLQQVQVEGLTAFYLLSTGQVNRSWRIIGIAIRSAVAMGLNLRSETDSVAHLSKETRYRMWWALFMLDTVLCVITGRPPSTGFIFCTTPLPIPYREEDFWDESVMQLITDQGTRNTLMTSLLTSNITTPGSNESSSDRTHSTTPASRRESQGEQTPQITTESPTPNISLYFLYAVDLAFLMREAIETLYAPGTARRSWLELENAVNTLNNNADNWLARLPAEFHFTELGTTRPFARQQASLGFRFYTTKLIISQPCLRRLAYQPHGAAWSPVCDTIAAMCVQVAGQMLDLLPDEADAAWFYGVSPWWCVLHYVMQSTTVLLVELFTRTQPGTTEAVELVAKVQKAVRWLCAMSRKDPSSRRAWLVCMDILSRHGAKFALNVDPC